MYYCYQPRYPWPHFAGKNNLLDNIHPQQFTVALDFTANMSYENSRFYSVLKTFGEAGPRELGRINIKII